MLLWSMCFLCAYFGLRWLFEGSSVRIAELGGGISHERLRVRGVMIALQDIEERLGAGLVPESSRWAALGALPAPWGPLAHESVDELRQRGGALMPTLKRLRALAEHQDAALAEARAKTSQAMAQALVCGGLVPAFGSALYFLLPALEERLALWFCACALSLGLAAAGALWMLKLAEAARWGGLPKRSRPWALLCQCAGERFLALVRSGNPPDLAWVRACAMLETAAPALARVWGASLWGDAAEKVALSDSAQRSGSPRAAGRSTRGEGALAPLFDAGVALRRAVQVSLMEGSPCAERVESALQALRRDLAAATERELQLLGTRALQPLFICVAPALFLLLACGLWASFAASGASGGEWTG
jgi:hypothetical protein